MAMKAVVLHETGPAESLRLETVDDPQPGPSDVIVRLEAAALNHRDVWIRKGQYAGIKLPVILGSDGCGTVVQVGTDISIDWLDWLGRSVMINPGLDWGPDSRASGPNFRILGMPDAGTFAELVRVPAENVCDRPAYLSANEAAAIPLAGLTAYRALVSRAQLKSGETVLITGIGGGVSALGLQIAKALGARVVVTSRSDWKLGEALKLGADATLNVASGDWSKEAIKLCGGEGPDVILDSVGGETFGRALSAVRRGGRIVTYGATTGPAERFEITKLFWKQVDLLGTTMGTPAEFAAMLSLFEKHAIRPAVARVFPLAEAGDAQNYMEQAEQFGKIVLDTR
jgi:zinc-binding alcohol dehydrogenase/oxidoreductase